jgi:hypothetical protein
MSFAEITNAQFIKWGADKTVQLSVMHPPQFGLTVRRVAFGQPGGSCANLGGELIDRIILPDFHSHQLNVIERQALDQIMAEHNFNHTMYADAGSAAQLGKILGPSALIIVSVDNCSPDQQQLYNDQKNFNGSITRAYISRTRYALEGSVRVVDLTTGQVIGSHNFEAKPERENQSTTGVAEFPATDEIKDMALEAVGAQVNAMFFPAANVANLVFYDDKDCGMKQVYEIYKNGDRDGALRMMDTQLEQCKSGHKKDKSLARAYYDSGLLHCLHQDYDVASTLFTSAMDGKGAEAVGTASSNCSNAKAGAAQLKEYEARLAQIPAPTPINASAATMPSSANTPETASASQPDAPAKVATSAPAGTTTAEERLKKLERLYKQGLINKKEYDEKRAEILKDL